MWIGAGWRGLWRKDFPLDCGGISVIIADMETNRTVQKVQLNGNDQYYWWAFDDGVMLRDKRGVGRHFASEAAALKAKA
jgi:hypothetical protein